MKAFQIFSIFLLVVLSILIIFQFTSEFIDSTYLTPTQKIGNIGYFTDKVVGIVFPGLNNSYIKYDPVLMKETAKIRTVNNSEPLPEGKFDIIIVGDSFVNNTFGFTNGISRIGNYSVLAFNMNDYPKIGGDHITLIRNLISSGYIEKTHPKFILIESAGRNDLDLLSKQSRPENYIANDIQSLNLWLRYGYRIDEIIEGLSSNIHINLLNYPFEWQWSSTEKGKRCGVNPVDDEPSIFQYPSPGYNVTAKFSQIRIPYNAALITKMRYDSESVKTDKSDNPKFSILVSEKSGKDTQIFCQNKGGGTGIRLIVIPLSDYGGKTLNITFKADSPLQGNGSNSWVMWTNPTIFTNPNITTTSFRELRGDTILNVNDLPDISAQLGDMPAIQILTNIFQGNSITRVRTTIFNTIKNQLDLSFDKNFHKARLNRKIHSSNIESDIIYYHSTADIVRENYNYEKLMAANDNLNNLSDELKKYNVTLLFMKPPDTSHMFEEYYVHPPVPNATRIYNDLTKIKKKYQYIDAYSIIRKRVHSGELDLYPIGTTHWAPTTGSYVAEEIVRVMNQTEKGEP